MTSLAHAAPLPHYWLRGRAFDLFFILGTASIALLCGALIFSQSAHLKLVAQLNVILLATPHFVATYTRLCFDHQSVRKYFFLLVPLPLLILSAVAVIAYSGEAWMIASVYLYWQWWHFSRQSYGISRMYLSQARTVYTPHALFDHYALYALPVCGILYRSYQQPTQYIGMAIHTLPVPYMLVLAAGMVAALLFIAQVWHWQKAYRSGKLPLPYLLYIGTHYSVFLTSYLLIRDINYGWLVFNLWHNLQYIIFVWLYNNRRFKMGEIAQHKVLTDMSRDQMAWIYFMVLVLFAVVLNYSINIAASHATDIYALLPWALIISMSVTFHHYTVDAIIWKRKRRTVYA